MYGLFGFDEVIRNVYKLGYQVTGPRNIDSFADLREPYLDLLARSQPTFPVNRSNEKFIEDATTERALARAFGGSSLNDLDQERTVGSSFSDDVRKRKLSRARDCLDELLSRDEKLRTVFDLCIHSVFVSDSGHTSNGLRSHGGSSSAAVGSIWLSMGDGLTRLDIMEMFVHELTHHLVFIDELNHGHFNYREIPLEKNFAFSAILNKSRPLDKVVHSIVVATELAMARRTVFIHDDVQRTVHGSDEKMIRDVVTACESLWQLENLSELVTPRVIDIVERCAERCKAYVAIADAEVHRVASDA